MKRFKLMVGALVMALLAIIAVVPSQAAPRTVALIQPQTISVQKDAQLPTFDIVCPALIFRDINDYPVTGLNAEIKNNNGNSEDGRPFIDRLDLVYFTPTTFQETLRRMRSDYRTLNEFADYRFAKSFDVTKPAISVIENRKNKSSPLKQ